MTHDWLNNQKARENIADLLQKMGLPLETRVSRICKNHHRLFDAASVGSSTYTTGRVVYNEGTTEGALREIDQVLSVYASFDSSEAVWLHVAVEVVIECKHRDGMALFVFPEEREHRFFPIPAVASEFATSPVLQKLLSNTPYLPASTIGVVGMLTNFSDRAKVSDENLIYKATASLYDYIQSRVSTAFQKKPDPLITELGLMEKFDALEVNSYPDPWEVASHWIRQVSKDEAYQAAIDALPDRELEALSTIFISIICIDGQIYDVEVDDQGAIGDITPIPYARTSVRIPSWPGVNETLFVSPRPEAMVTIVSVEHLSVLLDEIAEWCRNLIHGFYALDTAEGLFESLFMRSIRERLRTQRTTGFWHL